MNAKAILELRGVNKSFSDEFGLKDINLALHQGDVHVIMGENGSGKSLLMKIIAGIFTVDSGTILYNDEIINHVSVNKAMQNGIYYQHQDLPVFENLSAAENIYFDYRIRFNKKIKIWNALENISQCAELFKKLNINLSPIKKLGQYGFAERQLLFAAKAYISNAKIIIFDEPPAGMSEVERNTFFEILALIKQKVEAIFYVSHRLDEITKVGDKLSVMEQGKIISTNDIRNVNEKDIIRLITGKQEIHQYPKIGIKPNKECVLSVKNMTSRHILKDVSFNLYKQEILGITGLMGSGRTRLANCLFGIKQPDGGIISVEGKVRRFAHPLDALLAGISLIPEDRQVNGIFNPLKMSSNMTLPNLKRFMNNSILDDNIIRQVVKDYVKKLGITPDDPEDGIHYFSGGNQQKILLARWFMKRSLIYIMDEPTRGIDIASKIDIYNAMNNLIMKGASVILLSSDIDEIIGMCDRILILADGRITAELMQKDATKEKIYSLAIND